MACFTVVRVLVLLLAVVSLVLAIAGVFLPFFNMPSNKDATLKSLAATVTSADFDITTGRDTLARYTQLSGSPPAKSTMTLWVLHYGTAVSGVSSVDLRSTYFSCYKGNMMIQAAEGIAVVTCVLGATNLLLAIFAFFYSAVVKFPLALYFFLAAASAAVTFGLTAHLYLHGWCDDASLKSSGWKFGVGFILYIVTCALSLIASVLTMFVD